MRISIALATYNGARFLREQLDSLAEQECRPDEIVVGDDNSSDDTVAILHGFADDSGIPVKVEVNRPGLGLNRNFEKTFGRCTGDVILPCDQDDVWHRDKIRRLVEPFERDEAVTLCISSSCIVDDQGRSLGQTQPAKYERRYVRPLRGGEGFDALVRQQGIAGHAVAFRAAIRPILLPISDDCQYDVWLTAAAASAGRVVAIEEPLTDYRRHGSQSLGADTKSLLQQAREQKSLKLDHLQRKANMVRLLRERLIEHRDLAYDVDRRRAYLDRMIAFFDERLKMRQGRGLRTRLVAKLVLSGQYHRYARGLLTAARDLRGS